MTMLEERVAAPAATFSVTGGLAQDYIDRGEMIPWSGTLVVEGGDTGDKRSIEMGALTTRPLPMPFMVQLENPVGGDGHDGATLTGRIDTIERLDDGRWWGTGFIDPTSGDVGGVPVGTQLALALDKQMIRGVSVDLDQVSITEMRTKDGPKQIITAGRIIGATATPFQAFVECEIALDVDRMALAASAGSDWAEWESEINGHLAQVWTPTDAFETLVAFAGAIPVDPPLAWFARRKFTEFTPLTVLPNGQVYGHIAGKGTCHIGFSGKCEPLPSSHTNYAKFRNASVLTAEGTMVRTGPIVMDTVHPDLRWKASDAQSFYADTGAAVCDVVPYDDEFGMAVVGAMRPDVAPARIRAFRGSDISPDWRNIDGYRRECCALLAVNNSGFKLPQTLTASAGMFIEPGDTAIALDADDDVYALVASGPMRTEPCCAACAAGHHDDLVADADTGVDTSARDIRIGALRARFSVDTFGDTEAAVERDDELDDEDVMRRAAVRARFAKKKKKMPRYFRIASGTTVTDVVAEFTGTSDGARKAWQSRDRAVTEVERGTSVDHASQKHGVPAQAIRDELQRRKRVHDSERSARAGAPRHPNGAHVVVAHEQSDAEPGVVQGSTNAAPGEQIVYTVKFKDGTISSWPASRVKPAPRKSFRVAVPKAEAASAAAFAGALQAWLDTRPPARAFRQASGEFAGNSDGARKAWESRKKNSGSKPAGKPSQPPAPKPVDATAAKHASGKVGSSNHVGDALLKAGVPYGQAKRIAQVVGGDYKNAGGIDMPDAAIGDALLIAGYKHSEATAVIDAVKAARTKLDSKGHVKAVKAAAAAPAKKEPTLDKAHVESLFAKPAPAAKPAAGAKYSAETEPRDEHGKPVDFSRDVNAPVRPDQEGDWYANHMESGSFETDNKGNYLHYKMLVANKDPSKPGHVVKVTQGVRWSENTYSQKPDHARRVWRNRGAISDALAASPNVKKTGVGLINGGRTRVVFNDDGTMDIFNFDYGSQPPHATKVPAVK